MACYHARAGKTQRLSGLHLIDELPRSAIGKLLKREQRERFEAQKQAWRTASVSLQRRADRGPVQRGKRQVVAVRQRPATRHELARLHANGLEFPHIANVFEVAHQLAGRQVDSNNLVIDGFEMQSSHARP